MRIAQAVSTPCLSSLFMARSAEVEILKKGFLQFPVDPTFLGPRVHAIIEGMKRLTGDPRAAKALPWRTFATDAYGPRYGQEVGLIFKNDDDVKYTLQYTPEAFTNVGKDPALQSYLPLFDALFDIDAKAKEIALALAACFDAHNRGQIPSMQYPGSLVEALLAGRCISRVLCYPPQAKRIMRAKLHVDRSAITPHIYGSEQGLLVWDREIREWVPVEETSLSKIAVFPGEKFAACTRNVYNMYGTPHGVWCHKAPEENRYAIVCFAHPAANDNDAKWLLENRTKIEEFEASIPQPKFA